MKLLQKHRIFLCILLIALLGTGYACIGITSWKFSVVGDEWAFFSFAKDIAGRHLLVNPFGLKGVYGTHRVLSSYAQAIFLFLFGPHFAVWKFSSVFWLFPSVIVFYLFVKKLYGKTPALISTVLMAFSQYLGNFFKIGYTHSFCFFLFILCLYYANELLRNPSQRNALKLGISLGLSFFAYIGPLFSFFLVPFFVVLLKRKGKQALIALAITGITLFACVGIGLLTTPVREWFGGLAKTSLQREFDSNVQIVINIGRNFLLFFKNFDYFYNHFVAGPYLDPISRWAALIGIILALLRIRKKEGILLFLWIVLCIGLGLTNPYSYTPTTRGIFFIPYGLLFASLGLEFIRRRFRTWGTNYLVPLLVMLAIVLNMYEAQVGVFHQTGFSRTALIIKEVIRADRQNTSVLLVYSEHYHFDPRYIPRLMDVYNIPASRIELTQDPDMLQRTQHKIVLFFHDDQGFHQKGGPQRIPDSLSAIAIKGHFP